MSGARTTGWAAWLSGGALLVAGALAWLLGGQQAPNRTPYGSPHRDSQPLAPAPALDPEHVSREAGDHYRVTQRLTLRGPLEAKQFSWLTADALVQLELLVSYRSTLVRQTESELVERRVIERAGVLLAKLDLTDHALRKALALVGHLGLLVPGEPGTKLAAGVAARIGARLLRDLSDELARSWLEREGLDAAARLLGELDLVPDQATRRALRLPATLQSLEGREIEIVFRPGEPPTVRDLDGQPLDADARQLLSRSSIHLDSRFFAHAEAERFTLDAKDLEHFFWLSLIAPEEAKQQRFEPSGELVASLLPTPVKRAGRLHREFRLSGALQLQARGTTRAGGGLELAVTREHSFALLDIQSGVLREIELESEGAFAGWVLGRLFGLSAERRLAGKATIRAQQRCVRIE